MNHYIGFGLLAAAGLLAFFGVRASESLASDISRFFTGSPTDKSVWLLLGAIVCCVVGLTMMLRNPARAA